MQLPQLNLEAGYAFPSTVEAMLTDIDRLSRFLFQNNVNRSRILVRMPKYGKALVDGLALLKSLIWRVEFTRARSTTALNVAAVEQYPTILRMSLEDDPTQPFFPDLSVWCSNSPGLCADHRAKFYVATTWTLDRFFQEFHKKQSARLKKFRNGKPRIDVLLGSKLWVHVED